jgi:hypothetical protein
MIIFAVSKILSQGEIMKSIYKKLIFLVMLGLIILSISSCGLIDIFNNAFDDTCTQGNNMSNPRIAGAFDATIDTPKLTIIWDIGTERGTELPDKYFAEVKLQTIVKDSLDVPLINSVSFQSNPKSIEVLFGDLTTFLTSNEPLGFVLDFPDREGYIVCSHPGGPDTYMLNVTLKFDKGQFAVAELKETKVLGPF